MADFSTIVIVGILALTSAARGLGREIVSSNKSFFNLRRRDTKGEEHHRARRSTDYSRDDQLTILDHHNRLRSNVTPEAANMKYMEWDADLATMAQQWSDRCRFEHGNPENISPFSSIGQNLWIGTGYGQTGPSATGPIQSWYNEVDDYNYDTKECTSVCGHYTQVVWAKSYAVGCGKTLCSTAYSSKKNYNNAWLVTCNYGPAGNYQGALPYKKGSSCSLCDSGVGECFNNQCRLCEDHDEQCPCALQCQNCGALQSDCTCRCQDGWYGTDCSTFCEDTHEYCRKNPGWPGPGSCKLSTAVPKGCPLMCGVCNEADPDFICDRSVEVDYGVTLKLEHDIKKWSYIQLSLRDVIGSVVTDTCNTQTHITACCPTASQYSSSATLQFVDGGDVGVVSGYPEAVDSISYIALMVVRLPSTSALCTHGEQSTRRKRETDEAPVFLDQDVLLEAIQQNTERIEQELNVAVIDVYKGEPGKGASAGLVILIIIIVLLVIAAIAAAAFIIKKKHDQKVSENQAAGKGANRDASNAAGRNVKC